eukprot:scaffold66564_cov22-Tisochrysis_lutea.AAC.2
MIHDEESSQKGRVSVFMLESDQVHDHWAKKLCSNTSKTTKVHTSKAARSLHTANSFFPTTSPSAYAYPLTRRYPC